MSRSKLLGNLMDDPVIQCLAYVVKRTFITFGKLLEFLLRRLLDLIGLIFNLIAICTIIRAPATIYYLFFSDDFKLKYRWWYTGIWQFCVFLFDIPTILTFPFFVLCPWRIFFVVTEAREEKDFEWNDLAWEGCAIRLRIWKHFFFLLFDILSVPFVICLALSWRNVRTYRKCVKSSTNGEFEIKAVIVKEFIHLIGDIILFPLLFLLLISWRAPIIIGIMKKEYERNKLLSLDVKGEILCEYFFLILDILSLPAVIITVFSWRLPFFVSHMMYKNYASRKDLCNFYHKMRKVVWKNLIYFLMDIPCIISFIFLVALFPLTPWRLVLYVKTFKARVFPKPKYAMDNDGETKEVPPLSIIKRERRERVILLTVALLAILDVLAIIVSVILALTLWRLPSLISRLKKAYHDHFSSSDAPSNREESYELAYQRSYDDHYEIVRTTVEHTGIIWSVIYSEFLFLLLDILCGICAVIVFCTLWRGVPLFTNIRDVVRAAESCESINGMKIRKKILFHMAFLLVDIPAILLMFVHLIFVIKIPTILGAVIGGNFYLIFAMTVYMETGKLIIDIVFFIFFLVLILARPVAVWVHVLEDNEHKKARLSKESLVHIKWLLTQRKVYIRELDSMFSMLIKTVPEKKSGKNNNNVAYAKLLFAEIVLEHTKKLTAIRDELFKNELDDRLIYLLSKYIFFENKTAHIYSRKYFCEIQYIKGSSVTMHRRNLDLYEADERNWNVKREEALEELMSYAPEKTPLWKKTVGFRERTRVQNHKVLVECVTSGNFVTFLLCFVNTLFIYRAAKMYASFYRKWHLRNKIALKTLKEYLLDFLMLGKILLISLTLYKIPNVIEALITGLYYKRSVTAAREAVDAIPTEILHDMGRALALVLSWKTIAFIGSSILFFVLMPLSIMLDITKNFCKTLVCCRYFTGMILYCIAMAIPFVITLKVPSYFTSESALAPSSLSHIISGFLLYIILLLTTFVILKSRRSITLPYIDYVRINWFNIHVYVKVLIEFIQVLALVFTVEGTYYPYKSVHEEVSKYLLLDVYNHHIKFGVMVFVFVMWYLTASVPLILAGILKYIDSADFERGHYTWRAFLHFFGSTLFMVIPELSMSFLSCDYSKCIDTVQGCAYLIDADNKVQCWTANHKLYASISLFILMWYLLTSILICLKFDDSSNSSVDLKWTQFYSLSENILKILIVLCATMYRKNIFSLLAIVGILILNLLILLLWKPFTSLAVANSLKLFVWKITSLIILVTVTTMLFICEYLKVTNNSAMYGLLGFSCAIIIVYWIAIKCGIFDKFSEHERARKKFRSHITNTIKQLEGWDSFVPVWKSIKSPYLRMLRNVRVANPGDKSFEVEETIKEVEIKFTEELPPPPAYDDLAPMDPPAAPPSYEAILEEEQNKLKSDEYFVPSAVVYLKPLGDWESFDAGNIVKNDEWMVQNAADYMIQISNSTCTGSHLLLMLEGYINYKTFSFDFIKNLKEWREKVIKADWILLLECLLSLEANLDSSFDRPRNIDNQNGNLEKYLMDVNLDQSVFPSYFGLSDSHVIKERIHLRERQKLFDVIPEPWKILLGKLIPEDRPMLHKISFPDAGYTSRISIELFKEVVIDIIGVEEGGFKIAKGAKLRLPKIINVSEITVEKLEFAKPYISGSKGPIQRTVESFGAKMIEEKWYLTIGKNKAKFSKINATLGKLEFTL